MSVPRLRFKDGGGNYFPEWKSFILGSLGEFKNGINKSKEDFGHGVPFVNLMDVFGKPFFKSMNLGLVNAQPNEIGVYNLLKGDVLFIRSSVKPEGVGETSVVLEDLEETVYSGFIIRFREKNKTIDDFYKKYCFGTRSFRNQVLSVCTTSANTNINQDSLSKLTIALPCLKEQTKIATFLTAVDTKIAQLSKKVDLLESYKKGVMQKIFSQEIRFKDDGGNEFPEWEKKKIGEIGRFVGGGTPSTKNTDFWKGNIPWISSSDLSDDNIYKVNKTRFVSDEAVSSSATKIVPKNSVLIVSRVAVGKVAVNDVDICTSQDFTNLVLKDGNNVFFAYLIKIKTKQLLEFNQGTSIKGFVKSDLESMAILFPSLSEQKKVANFLNAIDDKISQTKNQLDNMKSFKKGLLQQMFV